MSEIILHGCLKRSYISENIRKYILQHGTDKDCNVGSFIKVGLKVVVFVLFFKLYQFCESGV